MTSAVKMIGGIALGLVVLSGCGGSGGDASCDPIAATLVSRVEVQPQTASMADGASLQLAARAFSCDGSQLALPPVQWSSADATTVSVSATGMALGLKLGGPVAVTAVAQGKQGSAQLTVVPRVVSTVTVEPATATVAAGRTSNLVVKAFDAQGRELPGRTATWSSANAAIVTVSQQGAITGVTSGGPVAVTANIEGHQGSSQVTVVNAAVGSVTVSPAAPTVPAGTTVQLDAVLKDDQGNVLIGRAVLWTTSDPVHTSVSTTGLVTGLVPGGPATILATSEGRSGSAQVTVTPGAAARLVFRTQPGNAAAGATIAPVVVEVQDALGNRVAGSTASVSVALGANPGGGALGGTLTVSAVDGIATLSTLTVDRSGEGYTLTAAATGLTGGTSTPFNITAGAATRLVFLVPPPAAVVTGVVMTPSVQVEVQDGLGNRVTSSTAPVTVALGANPGSATLGGTLTVNAVAGVATFGTLTLNRAGTGYTLTAAAGGLAGATSTAFNVVAGTAARLVFLVPPASVVAGAVMTPSVQVEVQDAQGNRATGSTVPVTLAFGANPGSATLGGTLTVNAVSGVATFATLAVNRAGTGYTLTAEASGLTGATSTPFNVTAGAAARLAFLVSPPATVVAGAVMTPSVQVEVQDAQGNRVTGSTVPVTLAFGANPGSGTLGGDASVNAVAGVATFSTLTVGAAGSGYTLTAAAPGLAGGTSTPFDVTAGTATRLVFLVPPPASVVAGAVMTPSVQVEVQDALGNRATGSTVPVTLAFGANPGSGTLGGDASVNAVAGVATFSTLTVDAVGSGYTLTAEAPGLAGGTSTPFDVVAGAAVRLSFLVSPPPTVGAGAGMTPPVQVEVQDARANRVTKSTASVTLALTVSAGATLTGGNATATGGVATFPGLSVNRAGTYTLTATATGLTAGQSGSFNVTPGALAQIVWVQQPSNVQRNAAISPAPTVRLLDALGNVVTSTVAVTMTITRPSGRVFTNSTTTVNAAGGVATFTNLRIGTTSNPTRIRANAGSIQSPESGNFRVQ